MKEGKFYKIFFYCHPSPRLKHSRVNSSWDPASFIKRHWIPAFAGMTVLFFCLILIKPISAGEVEINGDNIEYSIDGKKIIVTGNVVINYLDVVLTSDYAEFMQETNTAYAKGHVVVVNPQTEMTSDELTYDFTKKTLVTPPAVIYAPPFAITSRSMERRENGRVVALTGTYTTSDYDDPEYHWAASKVTYDPATSILTGRNVRLKFGRVPVFYWPWFSKKLDSKNPPGRHRLGYKEGWGKYLLNEWDYQINENIAAIMHLDYREMKDLAWGVDAYYDIPDATSGMLRTYYMQERDRLTSHWFEDVSPPTVETERYLAEWRHAWRPDDETQVITQVAYSTDDTIRGRYFEYRNQRDPRPSTFLTATKYLSYGAVSARVTPRVNNFQGQTEYLPEVRYDLPDQQIGGLGLYWKNSASAAYITSRAGGFTSEQDNNARVDWSQKFSYPLKAGILYITPFAGTRHTFFRDTLDPAEDNIVRNSANAGITASTKFFRTYDVHGRWLGDEFDGLRHVMTPSVTYEYLNDPTVDFTKLRQFDAIDAVDTAESVWFVLENKIQTKRNEQVVDILRAVISTKANLNQDDPPEIYGFETVDFEMDVRPVNWISLALNAQYDTDIGDISSFSGDLTVSKGRWSFAAGDRYGIDSDTEYTGRVSWNVNHKWQLSFYERYNVDRTIPLEEQYTFTRDLHSWTMNFSYRWLNYDGRKNEGELWIMFQLKDFHPKSQHFDHYGSAFYPKEAGVITREPEESRPAKVGAAFPGQGDY